MSLPSGVGTPTQVHQTQVLIWDGQTNEYKIGNFDISIDQVRKSNRSKATEDIRKSKPEGNIGNIEDIWLSNNYIEYDLEKLKKK